MNEGSFKTQKGFGSLKMVNVRYLCDCEISLLPTVTYRYFEIKDFTEISYSKKIPRPELLKEWG